MGAPIARRLLDAGYPLVVFDVSADAVSRSTGRGAVAATSAREVADRAETVLASLPTPAVSAAVAAEVSAGSAVRRYVMDVLNAGSGATHASRDTFPRAVLPRTFDYGFATGLMTKDVRLYLDEARSLGVPVQMAEAVAELWETTLAELGADSDFTSIVKPMEQAAGVTVSDGG